MFGCSIQLLVTVPVCQPHHLQQEEVNQLTVLQKATVWNKMTRWSDWQQLHRSSTLTNTIHISIWVLPIYKRNTHFLINSDTNDWLYQVQEIETQPISSPVGNSWHLRCVTGSGSILQTEQSTGTCQPSHRCPAAPPLSASLSRGRCSQPAAGRLMRCIENRLHCPIGEKQLIEQFMGQVPCAKGTTAGDGTRD